VEESASGADAPSGSVDFSVSLSESASVSDEISAAIDFVGQVQESVSAADTFISRLLWETINTSETTNWQTIPNAQVVSTIRQRGAFAENSFAGGPFAGGEVTYEVGTTSWSSVNTAQTTTWTVVETQT
jgi:hypothetical protein